MEGQGLEIQSPTNPESRVAEAATPSPAPVLVAVDLSPDSEAALIWAYGYAKRIVAPLEILHVVHDPADSPGTYKPNNGDLLDKINESGDYNDDIAAEIKKAIEDFKANGVY